MLQRSSSTNGLYLCKILFCYTLCPLTAVIEGTRWIGDIRTLYQHSLHDCLRLRAVGRELRRPLLVGVLELAEVAAELVDMDEMFAHVGGKNDVDEPLAHHFVRVRVEVLEYVHSLVRMRQLEPKRGVVVFEDSRVIVQDGKITSGVTKVRAVSTWMVDVMDNGTNEANGLVNAVQQALDILLFKEKCSRLHNVRSMTEK